MKPAIAIGAAAIDVEAQHGAEQGGKYVRDGVVAPDVAEARALDGA